MPELRISFYAHLNNNLLPYSISITPSLAINYSALQLLHDPINTSSSLRQGSHVHQCFERFTFNTTHFLTFTFNFTKNLLTADMDNNQHLGDSGRSQRLSYSEMDESGISQPHQHSNIDDSGSSQLQHPQNSFTGDQFQPQSYTSYAPSPMAASTMNPHSMT